MKPIRVGLFAVLVVLLASCTTFKISGVQVTAELPAYTEVGAFDIDVWVDKFLGSSGGATFLNVTADAMDAPIYDAIQREMRKYSADAAIDVTIEYEASFVNILLNAITGGIYAPAEAHVTGVLVKYSREK